MLAPRLLLALCCLSTALAARQTTYVDATEPGVHFDLPQERDPITGRRTEIEESNGLTVAWDGRLIMYVDSDNGDLWDGRPSGTQRQGFVFATFDPEAVVDDGQGKPDFGPAIGDSFARFAGVLSTAVPNQQGSQGQVNDYPAYGTYTDHYPFIESEFDATGSGSRTGSMGELGLLFINNLSNNMYPVEADDLPAGAKGMNPYPSDEYGGASLSGAYWTYRAYVTFQDLPKFWDANAAKWRGIDPSHPTKPEYTNYEPGLYPNGIDNQANTHTVKRNGICKLQIVVDRSIDQVLDVEVLEKWKPFRLAGPEGWDGEDWTTTPTVTVGISIPSTTEMYADNFEPILTNDGHLMVAKGFPELCINTGTSRVVFYYNQAPFAEDGWVGPWQFHHLYLHRDVDVDGFSIAERYPISRNPIKDYDGSVLGDANVHGEPGYGDLNQSEANASDFEGGYTWISPDGRYLLFSVFSGGVGKNHPELFVTTLPDGGGSSNRAQVSVVGSVTGWQMWRIDHAAENPSRHLFTAWDQDSRTTHQRNASFGFTPGFWDMLRGAPLLPLRDDGRTKLQLVNSQRLLYYELDLSPYMERDYGFYLPMTELLWLDPAQGPAYREVDVTRTPDLSGNGHTASVQGAMLPCEYFGLPTNINDDKKVEGLYVGADTPGEIAPLGTWTAGELVQDANGKYWIPLADWEDGKDTAPFDGTPDTTPFDGRGNVRDMDSDTCWGRVGQAMFFEQGARVVIDNSILQGESDPPAELNPGTTIPGAASELTASLWVRPLQGRTGATALLQHNVSIMLRKTGKVAIRGIGSGAPESLWLTSAQGAVPDGQWTHIAMTWKDTEAQNESEARLFINGLEVAARTDLPFDALATSTADIEIGCLAAVATDPDSAVLLLDEVALKQSALIESEVGDLALVDVPVPTWSTVPYPQTPLPFVDADARVPVANPYDVDKVLLGADLFRDVQLSDSKRMSCATCHDPARFFTEDAAVATGAGQQPLLRNTSTIFNQRFGVEQFWDARAADLEDQALDPILEPTEMNMVWADVKAYLEGDPDLWPQFANAYPNESEVTQDMVREVLANYMRVPTTGDSDVDRAESGSLGSLLPDQLRGRTLFHGKARCSACHNGPNFTDGRLWTTGTFRADGTDDGAGGPNAGPATAGRERFRGAFKTPTLRDVDKTSPYFHDGHAATLLDVVEFYNDGGVRQDANGFDLLDEEHELVAEQINTPLGLLDYEMTDLVAFLQALAGHDVDPGPAGLNLTPTAQFQSVQVEGPVGQDLTLTATVRIQDNDGASDLDPTGMPWSLELEVDGVVYDLDDLSVASITRGYDATLVLTPAPPTAGMRVRASDMHGAWSGWTYY